MAINDDGKSWAATGTATAGWTASGIDGDGGLGGGRYGDGRFGEDGWAAVGSARRRGAGRRQVLATEGWTAADTATAGWAAIGTATAGRAAASKMVTAGLWRRKVRRVGDGRLWAARLGGGRYGDGRLRGGRVIQNSDSRLGSGRKYGNGRLGGGYGEGRLGGSRYSNGGCLGAAGAAVAGWVTAGTAIEGRREDRRSVGGRGWCIGGRRRGRKVAEDRGVEGRREVEVAFLKRALEVTKSTGGREGLEGKSSADGGLGHGAEGLNSEG